MSTPGEPGRVVTDRIKTAMVVFALETELGELVVSREDDPQGLPPDIVQEIDQRTRENRARSTRASVRATLEEAYLNEVFRLADSVTHGTSLQTHLQHLRSLCEVLEIYQIRNAVSHPNRPFPACYWYRVATIATDPTVDVLGLSGVRDAFQRALAGTIDEPPESWLSGMTSVIPNTLPARFDHEITGLVGREREARQIKTYLSNPRVSTLAVIAPGGVGKTALALDILRDLCQSPAFAEFADAVCFVSCKTERLTHVGIERLSAVETINEVETALCLQIGTIFDDAHLETFRECTERYGKKKLILFLDNLETLIRDQREELRAFHLALPVSWRLVLTSRVGLDSATVFPLEVLPVPAAEHLCRTYAARSGAGTLSTDVVTRVATEAGKNPLAIRLTVDLYRVGGELPAAVSDARREVIAFSFTNLIDALSELAVRVLECLFVLERSSRADIADVLDIGPDEVAQAIADLSQTSLVNRDNSEEREAYTLTPAVRELLLTNPRNLAHRDKVIASVNARKQREREIDARQVQAGTPLWHPFYIPPGSPQSIKLACSTAVRVISQRSPDGDALARVLRELRQLASEHPRQAVVHRFLAHTLKRVRDKAAWEREYRFANELEPTNPSALAALARALFENKDYQEAETAYSSLWKGDWQSPDRSDEEFASSISYGYFLSLLFQGKSDEVLALTRDWNSQGSLRGLWGTIRASAWKRHVEQFSVRESQRVIDGLHSAIAILDDVIRNHGYTAHTSRESMKIIEEIVFRLDHPAYLEYAAGIPEWLSFADRHLLTVSGDSKESSDKRNQAIRVLSGIRLATNPFVTTRWTGYLDSVSQRLSPAQQRVAPDGFVDVTVYFIASTRGYLFARDTNGLEYHVHSNSVDDGDWYDWQRLDSGSRIFVRPERSRQLPGKAVPTSSALVR